MPSLLRSCGLSYQKITELYFDIGSKHVGLQKDFFQVSDFSSVFDQFSVLLLAHSPVVFEDPEALFYILRSFYDVLITSSSDQVALRHFFLEASKRTDLFSVLLSHQVSLQLLVLSLMLALINVRPDLSHGAPDALSSWLSQSVPLAPRHATSPGLKFWEDGALSAEDPSPRKISSQGGIRCHR